MKKVYEKPMIVMEDFENEQYIARSCQNKDGMQDGAANLGDENTCTFVINSVWSNDTLTLYNWGNEKCQEALRKQGINDMMTAGWFILEAWTSIDLGENNIFQS